MHAAKKAISKMPVRTIKSGDRVSPPIVYPVLKIKQPNNTLRMFVCPYVLVSVCGCVCARVCVCGHVFGCVGGEYV